MATISLLDWLNGSQGISLEGGLSGQAGKVLGVDVAETGLEWKDVEPFSNTKTLDALGIYAWGEETLYSQNQARCLGFH